MVAFGGPAKSEEIRPFLANVLHGVPIPPERLEEVARHYEALGGRSPITELTFQQAKSLAVLLEREGPALPVYVGMRYWHPFVAEVVAQMGRDGVRRAVGLIMAPHDSGAASWGKSVAAVTTALGIAGPEALHVDFAQPCYDHPDFIAAMAERVHAQLQAIPHAHRHGTPLIFTAHSIPTAIAASSPYVQQLEASCRLVAETLGHPGWSLAYQSRSGNPREAWLEPDIRDVLRTLHAQEHRLVVVAPIGFVCDNVEIRYDLGVEAKALADTLGIEFRQAGTVNDHPLYIRALADLVRRRAAQG
ncbi:ferrochelatase [Candidatus Methylomirabilis lanthanidiphila]|uniref:Ferrochelatase n=1 Tax=Candidatus Methylomirabilis lanthanidiphila TaxID=2211376 RepID=A0A564ZKM5_9BACT|nr:ferrochelatase [Candidatus Methylomirabilis lanthanidiphila]